MQYFGRKAWWFFPPGKTPVPTYPPAVSMGHWVKHMLPALLRDEAGGPMHCVVEEGEWLYLLRQNDCLCSLSLSLCSLSLSLSLCVCVCPRCLSPRACCYICVTRCRYVPEGWYHATFALEDSVSVASQLGGVGPASLGQQAVTDVQRLWSELWLLSNSNRVAAAIEKSHEIMALAPDNREVIYQRALLLSRLATAAAPAGSTALLSEAVAGFKAAIDANPRQAEPYNNYAALVMAGWQQQQQAGDPAALKLKGLKSVRAALQQATELNPTNANAWENLALLHEYDSQRMMLQHAQPATKKKGKKSKQRQSQSPGERERELRELAAAAAEARRNAREAAAVLQGFSDPS